jgi:hypothetical protein
MKSIADEALQLESPQQIENFIKEKIPFIAQLVD